MMLIHPQKPPEQPFSNDPQASYTLASRYYTDANIYEQEKAAIFLEVLGLCGPCLSTTAGRGLFNYGYPWPAGLNHYASGRRTRRFF